MFHPSKYLRYDHNASTRVTQLVSILIMLILDVYKSFDLGMCIPEVKERGCNVNTKFPQKQGKILFMSILLKFW